MSIVYFNRRSWDGDIHTYMYVLDVNEFNLFVSSTEHGMPVTIHVSHASFNRYAVKALTRLKLDPTLTEDQLQRAHACMARWKEIVAFYTVRLALAPVMESLVLLDRVAFLQEHGK